MVLVCERAKNFLSLAHKFARLLLQKVIRTVMHACIKAWSLQCMISGNVHVQVHVQAPNNTSRHKSLWGNILARCFALAKIHARPKFAVLVKTDGLEQKIIFEQYRLSPHSKIHNVLYRNLIHPT